MLINSRVKLTNKKLSSSISSPQSTILASNPEIQLLVEKLMVISESLPEQRPATLNLIQWEKEKYRPSQNENRIRIQNQISLIKVCNERVRSRVKPIKRAHSIDLANHHPMPYRQHYEEIKQAFNRKISCSQTYQSEEQLESPPLPKPEQNRGGRIKYFQNLKKYNRIVDFIAGKLELRSEEKQKGGIKSFYSQSLPASPDSRHQPRTIQKHSSAVQKKKYSPVMDHHSNPKVSSIVKKWKPLSKIQRIFSKTADSRHNNRKRLSWGENKPEFVKDEASLSGQASLADDSTIFNQNYIKQTQN